MIKRRFVASKVEHAARTTGITLFPAGLIAFLFEPSASMSNAGASCLMGGLLLSYGSSKKENGK